MTFQLEAWRDFFPEALLLMERHYSEIALNQAQIKFSLDSKKYQSMEESGMLHVLAVRIGAKLIGYYIAFVLPHIHYQNAGLMAFTDIYYLLPEYRRGNSGVQMFIEAEESLRKKGVVKAYISTKLHKDATALFEQLGWTATDKAFTKMLEVA